MGASVELRIEDFASPYYSGGGVSAVQSQTIACFLWGREDTTTSLIHIVIGVNLGFQVSALHIFFAPLLSFPPTRSLFMTRISAIRFTVHSVPDVPNKQWSLTAPCVTNRGVDYRILRITMS